MNYKALQEKQEELDQFIIESKGLQDMSPEHLLSNMILACHDELIEVYDAPEDAEEWIDVLHFVLSIANKLDVDLDEVDFAPRKYVGHGLCRMQYDSVELLFYITRLTNAFKHWSNKVPSEQEITAYSECLLIMADIIKQACGKLGVDMVEEYDKKYEINKERQREGY